MQQCRPAGYASFPRFSSLVTECVHPANNCWKAARRAKTRYFKERNREQPGWIASRRRKREPTRARWHAQSRNGSGKTVNLGHINGKKKASRHSTGISNMSTVRQAGTNVPFPTIGQMLGMDVWCYINNTQPHRACLLRACLMKR